MERKYRAVIFDFDFTLGDSAKGIEKSINYALLELGYEEREMAEIKKTIGLSLKDTFFSLTGDPDSEKAALFSSCFKRKADEVMVANTDLYPPVKAVFTALREAGCAIGIVTTKYHYRIDQILSKYEMSEMVEIIVGADDVAVEKPDPQGLLYAVSYLNLDIREVLYVGDSLVDAEAAHRAHVDFAGVLTGTTEREAFGRFDPVAVQADLCGILELI